jgi:ZIP family zinc transporter
MVYLSFSLGFSAGVMVYISFMDLLPHGIAGVGMIWATFAFFIGIIVIGVIDMLIPEAVNPHSFKVDRKPQITKEMKLMRTSIFLALAIGIHNFPEGLATFGTALSSVKLGVIIALAIAIHNIPEGISVSVPLYYATGNKKKAFMYSFLSGMAEPVGAIIGFLILLPFLTTALLAALLAFVAGIMVYVSIDELLPMAHHYGHNHIVIIGVALGMLIMATSIIMLEL